MNLDQDAHPYLKEKLAGFHELSGRYQIRIRERFESSHYLYNYLPDGSNEPHHGHTWEVQIVLTNERQNLQGDGICIDFLAVRKRMNDLIERIDHLCINDLDEFQGINPTAEYITRWSYKGLLDEVESQKAKIARSSSL